MKFRAFAFGIIAHTAVSAVSSFSLEAAASLRSLGFDPWLRQQYQVSCGRLLSSIHSPQALALSANYPLPRVNPHEAFGQGALRGMVIAAPWSGREVGSGREHNYKRHWIRDAALTLFTVMDEIETLPPGDLRNDLVEIMKDQVQVAREIQRAQLALPPDHAKAKVGLGAAWVNLNGQINLGEWGEPQNDGPALRVQLMIRFAEFLMREGNPADLIYVQENLFSSDTDRHTVIQADLDYTTRTLLDRDYDIWEMMLGHHFFNRLAKRDAFAMAVPFLHRFNERFGAPNALRLEGVYASSASLLQNLLNYEHWSDTFLTFRGTVGRPANSGKDYVTDSAVILAVLNHRDNKGPLSVTDDRVLATAYKLKVLSTQHAINDKEKGHPGIAIIRHQGDEFWGGNPWFLSTAAFGELAYRVALTHAADGYIQILPRALGYYLSALPASESKVREAVRLACHSGQTIDRQNPLFQQILSGLFNEGDLFAQRIKAHVDDDGNLHEQIRGLDGYSTAASDLTWSHAAYIRLFRARESAISTFTGIGIPIPPPTNRKSP